MTAAAISPRAAVVRVLAWRPALLAVHLGSIAILSRLVGPEAFGVFAITVAAVLLAEVAIDFGVSPDLLRGSERELSGTALRPALGLWITTATVATILFAGVAAGLAATGANPPLAAALAIAALAFPAIPVTLAADVVLRRRLDMRLLSWLPAVAALAGLGISVVAALAGLGAAALAAGLVGERLVAAGILAVAQGRVLAVRPSFTGWRVHLRFGGTYTATVLLPKIAVIARLSLIGVQLGADAVGLLNRAQAVADLNDRAVLRSILPIGLPLMANAAREGLPAPDIYRAKVDYLIVLCWPAAAVVALLAEPLVLILLGAGWEGSVTPVRILALAGLSYPVTKMGVKYFALIGAEGVMLGIQLRQQALALVLVGAASFASLAWVCAALVLAQGIKALQVSAAVGRLNGAVPSLMPVVWRGAGVSLAAAAAPVAVVTALPDASAPVAAALGLGGAALGWAAALLVGRHPLAGHARRLLARGA